MVFYCTTCLFCVILALSGVFFFATEEEVDQFYGEIFKALAWLGLGFAFYAKHFPESYLDALFGEGHRYRALKEKLQLCFPSHSFWHLGVAASGYSLFWVCFAFSKHVEKCHGTDVTLNTYI